MSIRKTTVGGSLAALLEPLALGDRTLRNRVVVTAHATHNIDSEGLPNADDVAYLAERARGGAAMVTMGLAAVHPSSPTPYGIYRNFDDRIVPRYEQLSTAVHDYGGLILTQLGHMGARTDGETGPAWAPSQVSHHSWGSVPYAMSRSDVRTIVDAFAGAAERSVRGGMDGVEISAGHGLLINQFLSPLTNQREDEYGGDDERRFRFCRQVLETVREAIGDAILVVRVNGADEVPGSLGQQAWLEIDQRIAETGLVDAINVSANFDGSVVPTMAAPRGCYLHYARKVRERVDVPVCAVGRITDPSMAAQAIEDGDADFVGMTRAHIADPHLVNKVRAGRTDEIRPCIGCIQMCLGELERHRNVKCVYNPVTGRERLVRDLETTPASTSRHVVVVGGGPAGLETARVSALRGHRVTLFDERPELGGVVRVAARTDGRDGLVDAVDWLGNEVRRLGVDVRLRRTAEASDVVALEPDVVVLATGASETLPQWAPRDDRRLLAAADVVAGRPKLSGRVVVVDESDRTSGMSAALAAAARGCDVQLLTTRPGPGELVEPEVRHDFLTRLTAAGVVIHCSTQVRAYDVAEGVLHCGVGGLATMTYRDVNAQGRPVEQARQDLTIAADHVVHTWTEPRAELFEDLPASLDVRAVGDVLHPHRIEGAVHAAFDLAVEL
ncbi:2,4-dienoyl-CoA reductase-like NADH-dependent reductase (Old Yellow Enzyme family) [Streptomyces sp. PanSC19]|uniref:oxidoreductase n=1 Tax=Streptomyces sp. PanSC19 TaxID=1520455 RepID=UPI000FA01510|nr:FAD-dependent oxidoreductase [Streptomyces sp. PanSC19]ROQ35863.1 2,4-dienoyl-CoA reductase-like NADH-dependent reductase (Old Yellow Enzyme family) [Streptomyces sp. PanSC19]